MACTAPVVALNVIRLLWRKDITGDGATAAVENPPVAAQRAVALPFVVVALEPDRDRTLVDRAIPKLKGLGSVIVGVSGGKDSLATLELCADAGLKIGAYFMYLIPGLSFQERFLNYLERRYRIKIYRLPHFGLSAILRGASYRPHSQTTDCAAVKWGDIETEAKRLTGFDWLAYGFKSCDSLQRRGLLKKNGGIDEAGHRIYPIHDWSHAKVFSFLRQRRIPLPADYQLTGQGSFGRLSYDHLAKIEKRFPDDFEKIKERFPFVEAVLARERFKQVPKV